MLWLAIIIASAGPEEHHERQINNHNPRSPVRVVWIHCPLLERSGASHQSYPALAWFGWRLLVVPGARAGATFSWRCAWSPSWIKQLIPIPDDNIPITSGIYISTSFVWRSTWDRQNLNHPLRDCYGRFARRSNSRIPRSNICDLPRDEDIL